jgi:protein SCO1/2
VVSASAIAALLAVTAYVPVMHEGDTLPAVPLVDQSGAAFSFAALRGDAVVLAFVYTRCSDARMCPLVSSKYAQMQRAIGTAPVKLVEITLDPAYDTPAVLRRYGRGFGQDPARWILATGSAASIDDLTARLGIASAWTRPGTLAHAEAAVVLDRRGAIARIIDGNAWTANDVVALARDAAGERSAPLERIGVWLTAAVERCGGGGAPIDALEMLALIVALTGAFGFALVRALRPSGRT